MLSIEATSTFIKNYNILDTISLTWLSESRRGRILVQTTPPLLLNFSCILSVEVQLSEKSSFQVNQDSFEFLIDLKKEKNKYDYAISFFIF